MKMTISVLAAVLCLGSTAAEARGMTEGRAVAVCEEALKARYGDDARVKLRRIRSGPRVCMLVNAGGERFRAVCAFDGGELVRIDGPAADVAGGPTKPASS